MTHTIRRPSSLVPAEGSSSLDRTDTARLEPDISSWFPGVDVLVLGHSGHIELAGSKVHDARGGHEAEGVSGRDGDYGLPGTSPETTHVGAVDVRDAAVVARVGDFGLADREPVCALGLAIDNHSREFICGETGGER